MVAGVGSRPVFGKAGGSACQIRDPGVVVAEDSRARPILKRVDEMRWQLRGAEHGADDRSSRCGVGVGVPATLHRQADCRGKVTVSPEQTRA